MTHIKYIGYIAIALLAFILLTIVAPALISAKSTIAVIAGIAIVLGVFYTAFYAVLNAYKTSKSNKENSQ